MTLLRDDELDQVAAAIARAERQTDAELVTVLAAQADDYTYIPLLWAGAVALVAPGLVNYFPGWLDHHHLLLAQWLTFGVCAVLFRLPGVRTRLIPAPVRRWRAANLARRQFLERGLHHTAGDTGMLIFVSEAERYVEILVDRGIAAKVDDAVWAPIIATFTANVRAGRTLDGFVACIDSCGAVLAQHVPVSHARNELPDRLVVLGPEDLRA